LTDVRKYRQDATKLKVPFVKNYIGDSCSVLGPITSENKSMILCVLWEKDYIN